jgi:hypothetical protein
VSVINVGNGASSMVREGGTDNDQYFGADASGGVALAVGFTRSFLGNQNQNQGLVRRMNLLDGTVQTRRHFNVNDVAILWRAASVSGAVAGEHVVAGTVDDGGGMIVARLNATLGSVVARRITLAGTNAAPRRVIAAGGSVYVSGVRQVGGVPRGVLLRLAAETLAVQDAIDIVGDGNTEAMDILLDGDDLVVAGIIPGGGLWLRVDPQSLALRSLRRVVDVPLRSVQRRGPDLVVVGEFAVNVSVASVVVVNGDDDGIVGQTLPFMGRVGQAQHQPLLTVGGQDALAGLRDGAVFAVPLRGALDARCDDDALVGGLAAPMAVVDDVTVSAVAVSDAAIALSDAAVDLNPAAVAVTEGACPTP